MRIKEKDVLNLAEASGSPTLFFFPGVIGLSEMRIKQFSSCMKLIPAYICVPSDLQPYA